MRTVEEIVFKHWLDWMAISHPRSGPHTLEDFYDDTSWSWFIDAVKEYAAEEAKEFMKFKFPTLEDQQINNFYSQFKVDKTLNNFKSEKIR